MTSSATLRSFINGKFVSSKTPQGGGASIYNLFNAATGKIRQPVQMATSDEINECVHVAREAQGRWSKDYSPQGRSKILLRASQIMNDRANDIAIAETLDTGRPLSETQYEAPGAIDCLEYQSGAALTVSGQHIDLSGGSWGYTRREAIGTTVGIGAWNYPLQSAIWKSAPALAFGNSMIFKPSELTPTNALTLAEIYMEAGLPEGVFNVVLGDGPVGTSLVNHDGIDKVSFTGSVDTGRKVYTSASDAFKKVTLELGGKSPLIIFDDVRNMKDAVTAAMVANWYSSGQVCSNGTRVFVHESIHDEFVTQLIDATSKLVIGNPMDESTQIGPMVSKDHMEKVKKYIDLGKNHDQATLVYGGECILSDTGGYYLSPAIFTGCTDDMRIVKEEVFGMVMSILTFTDEDEVLNRANDTTFGLSAGVFTKDIQRAHRMIHNLQAGTTWINNYNLAPVELPWGGFKNSGLGSENGLAGVESWSRLKSVYVEMGNIESPYE